MKRLFDFSASLIAIVVLVVPMLFIAAFIKLTSKGPILYWSDRVGRNNTIFKMPKFRTMRVDTPIVATHLLKDSDRFMTPVGRLLRNSSLDELPQLFNIFRGEMSFVGPRPALYNQYDLVDLRTKKGVHVLIPGLTGWAQINGRDELSITVKVEYDLYYLVNRSFLLDLKILSSSIIKILRQEDIHH